MFRKSEALKKHQ
jgi:hypothetical protein